MLGALQVDVYCPKCGEPWDTYELHDAEGKSYREAQREFSASGCEVFGSSHNTNTNDLRAEASAVLMDLLGDDFDGVASMLEDAEYIGLFNE